MRGQINLGVAQLVARYLGVVEAAGSSPVTQTKIMAVLCGVSRSRHDYFRSETGSVLQKFYKIFCGLFFALIFRVGLLRFPLNFSRLSAFVDY